MTLRYAARRLLKFLQLQKGRWVSACEFQAIGLRFYRQRIYDLRRAGYAIETHREYANGRIDTCYRLREGNEAPAGAGGEDHGQRTGKPGDAGRRLARTA